MYTWHNNFNRPYESYWARVHRFCALNLPQSADFMKLFARQGGGISLPTRGILDDHNSLCSALEIAPDDLKTLHWPYYRLKGASNNCTKMQRIHGCDV